MIKTNKKFKNILINFIFVYFFLLFNNAFAVIKSTDNLDHLEKILATTKSDALVVFDVDEVLMVPVKDYNLKQPYRKSLLRKLKKKYSIPNYQVLESIILYNTKYQLIEPRIINILESLKKNKIPAVALTCMGTGSFGVIDSLQNLRIKNLKEMGLDFSQLTPIYEEIVARELSKVKKIVPEFVGLPIIKSGVIFSAGIDKAVALEYFLNKKNYYPKNIIFIDDYLPNVSSLEEMCNKLKINFEGIHYTAADSMMPIKINEKKEDLRFELLEKQKRWLVDDKKLILVNKYE